MSSTVTAGSLLGDLEKVARVRREIVGYLERMTDTLKQGESEGQSSSGGLGFERNIEDLTLATQNLRRGVFRLLVLGDMKRGKSTLLNALLGENLLPSDVNPCTAVLTVLRYGAEKKVTVYFKDGKSPHRMDFKTFKQEYTIDPEEAKKLEEQKKIAFPDVEYAVVEYPLPLLEKGIEIVDSPGLNDTEARNEISLNYINNCHAILFVLRASQPCTLAERRYLENYIKGRGLTVFFLINAWDEVRDSLIDPDDRKELEEAEWKLRQVFHSNLAQYCQVDGHDIYEERVFELSSINALRRRLKNPEDTLEGTGFPAFTEALSTFLTQERAIAELRQARILARQTYNHVREAVDRRIPLLEQDVNELKRRIESVEPEFKKLTQIRDEFKGEILAVRDSKARAIADSFRNYILNLGNTFETDFLRYQPTIGFLEFLSAGRREEFNAAFQQAFQQYLNDKISAWELTATAEIREAFSELTRKAANFGAAYNQVAGAINEKLIGQKIYTTNLESDDNSPSWASWAMGFISLASANPAGLLLASVGFDWKNILVNWIGVIGIWSFLSIFSVSFIAGPLGFVLLGLGVGALQVEQGRKELVKTTKKEFVKHLPQLAQEQWQSIHQGVKDCFDSYEREVSKRIDDDINSRKAELDNLLKQKESREINRETEVKRLKNLEADVSSQSQNVESVYEQLLAV